MRFDDQAIFHPRKYMLAVAAKIHEQGGLILEQTVAHKIEENEDNCTVTCDHGVVTAKDVIIATNYPIKDPKLFFARLTTRQSYAVAAHLENPFPAAYFYSTGQSFHSLRPHLLGTDEEIVIFGGEGHPAGQGGDTKERYVRLEKWVRRNFRVKSIDYTWSTHDSETFDRVPMIGKLTSNSKHLYVATGLKGWGMSHGVAAGMILSDNIMQRDNQWSARYNPNRLKSFLSTEMLAYDVSSVTSLSRANSPASMRA